MATLETAFEGAATAAGVTLGLPETAAIALGGWAAPHLADGVASATKSAGNAALHYFTDVYHAWNSYGGTHMK